MHPAGEPLGREVRIERKRGALFLTVELVDGQTHSLPLDFFPTLVSASASARRGWERVGQGVGFHWPALDLDLSVRGMLEGRREHLPPPGWREGLAARLAAFKRARGLG